MNRQSQENGKRYVEIPSVLNNSDLNNLADGAKRGGAFFSPGEMLHFAKRYGPKALTATIILFETIRYILTK